MELEGCSCGVKKRKVSPCDRPQIPCYKELRAGRPEGNDPLYLIVDRANASVQLSPSSSFFNTKFGVDLDQAIEGYSKCSLVHVYLNNVAAFSGNDLGYIGISIDEIPGSVRLSTKNPYVTGKQYKVPTFLVPRVYPYDGTQPAPDTNAIVYFESTKNQFEIDVSTVNVSRMSITVVDQFFNALSAVGPVTNFEFRFLLRFYNDVYDKGACKCNC